MDLQLEKLSSDIIDEDFGKVFYGLHFLQGIIGRLSVQIKHGFATVPPIWYFFYSIAIVTTSLICLIGFTLQCETANNSILVENHFKIGHVLNLSLVLKTFIRDIKGNSSSDFYVKLHKIDRDLNFKNGKQCNENLTKYVTYFCIGLFIIAAALSSLFNIYCMKSFCPFAILILLPEGTGCLDMVIVTITIYYVSIRVGYIITTLEAIKNKIRNEIKSCERLMSKIEDDSEDVIQWDHLLLGMKSILTVMADFRDLYQYQIFSFTCQLLLWVMIAIQSSIIKIKNQCPLDNIMPSTITAASMVMLKAVFFAVCVAADSLSYKLEKSRKICVDIRHTCDDKFAVYLTMKTTEYLSNDILDEGYLKLFSPFRVVQMILGSCRVDARDRFVTSPTKAQKFYTLFCIIICTVLYISVAVNFLPKFWPYENVYYLNLTALFWHYTMYVCNIVHVRFMNNDENVKFYMKAQEIDRKLKIDNNKFINDLIFNSNVVTVVLAIIILLILYASALTENFMIFLGFGGLLYSQLTCMLEWLYCSNLLFFFYIRLRFINAIIVNHIEGTEDIEMENTDRVKFPTMKVLRFIASSGHDFKYSETDVYLKDIFDEMIIFQNLYRFQVFWFCFRFVTSTLLSFQYGLLALQNDLLTWMEYIVLPTIIAIDLLMVIVVSVRSEAFSREIKNTKYLCTTILSLYYGGPLRRKAVKMLKMITEKPPRFSVYDMWYMDATTLISMINLVTTLMVTLLQFALL